MNPLPHSIDKRNNPILSVEKVSVCYPNQQKPVIQNISFSVQPHEFVLLVGASGSGKSTLTFCLNGLIPKQIPGDFSGNIKIDGQDLSRLSLTEISKNIGMVFQNPESQMLIAETVEEEVAFGLEMRCTPWAEMDRKITHGLQQVGLEDRRKAKIQHLSLGQKQKLALAAILALEPKILILDEPSAALDPEATQQLFHILKRLKAEKKISLILIEHKLNHVFSWMDRVLCLTSQGMLFDQEIWPDNIRQEAQFNDVDLSSRPHHFDQATLSTHFPQEVMAHHQERLTPLSPLEFFARHQAFLAQEGIWVPYQASPSWPLLLQDKDPEIQVKDLSTTFGENLVLQNINLTFAKGKIIAMIGENGAGKTTLTRHFIKDIHPAKGTVFLQGVDICQLSQKELTQTVGYVFQNPEHQFLEDTVLEELLFGFHLQKKPKDEAIALSLALLQQWGLLSEAQNSPFCLSQGQKRRLSLLTMLSLGQKILILDEPTWGLDQKNILLLFQKLLELKAQEKTILFITHDMDLVKQYADQVVVLQKGQVVWQGIPEILFQNPELLQKAHLDIPGERSLYESV